jgi:hypothetical protein
MLRVRVGTRVVAQDVFDDPEEDATSVLRFDWPWEARETIWLCRHCSPWRAELFLLGAGRRHLGS